MPGASHMRGDCAGDDCLGHSVCLAVRGWSLEMWPCLIQVCWERGTLARDDECLRYEHIPDPGGWQAHLLWPLIISQSGERQVSEARPDRNVLLVGMLEGAWS